MSLIFETDNFTIETPDKKPHIDRNDGGHIWIFPSSIKTFPLWESFAHSESTSSLVLQETINEIDGLNLKRGPALIAINF